MPKKRKVIDLDFVLNDFNIGKSVEVEWQGEILILDYKEIGRKAEDIEKQLFDQNKPNLTALHIQREIAWQMVKKANPKLYTDAMREKFPIGLLDKIVLAIAFEDRDLKKNLTI